jgi:hypothetical protein
MQGNGGLFPLILNTCIRSTLNFYHHSPANLPVAKGRPGPSKYETTSAHIGEWLGLSVFDLWIAAYECSTFFRNVPEEGIISNPAVEASSPDR